MISAPLNPRMTVVGSEFRRAHRFFPAQITAAANSCCTRRTVTLTSWCCARSLAVYSPVQARRVIARDNLGEIFRSAPRRRGANPGF